MEQILPTIDMINTVAIYRVLHLNRLAEFLQQYGFAEFSQIPKRRPIGTNNVVVWCCVKVPLQWATENLFDS